MLKRTLPSLFTLLAALLATVCTGERPSLAETVKTDSSTATTDDAHTPTEVAEATGPAVPVFSTEGDAAPSATLQVADQVGKHLVFVVLHHDGDWLEVQLPVPAEGDVGWVESGTVDVTTHEYRVEVDRGDHRLRVFQGSTSVLDEPVSIGTTDGPPAGSSFFIKELLEPPDANGPYGRYVYGFSGSTNDLAELQSGDGVIGIHGTNDPAAPGGDVEHGSLRLSNDAMTKLVDQIGLPLGTPVEIKP